MQTRIVASLLLAAFLLAQTPQAWSRRVSRRDLLSREAPLDLVPTSFDDQYAGCGAAMEAALPDLKRAELNASPVFAEAWLSAAARWQERRAWGGPGTPTSGRPGFRDEHAVALLAYTANSPLHREFNAAVREAGRSRAYYLRYFPFKALHFLLTEALRLLGSGQQPRCYQVYRGVHGVRFRPAGPGAVVRLGAFASASLRDAAAHQFGEDTFFGIWTCHGVLIKGYSFFPGEEEVLIPPYETFLVVNASAPAHGPVRIYLKAQDKASTFNCEYIKDKQCTSGRCKQNNSGKTNQGLRSLEGKNNHSLRTVDKVWQSATKEGTKSSTI
ncbi:GPI-linked NAD(P)(+)--arginine ADP-ribosyltransferase 1 isoform X2 [Macrotis lagotis]|uniref:GPI-linked NAD(P)(+)--arginine ADP-ribosyltransferase 1 isoform X2 n=1 Tax=Macrotis lagotis TaxID=92651 RepID=UPI003D691E4F